MHNILSIICSMLTLPLYIQKHWKTLSNLETTEKKVHFYSQNVKTNSNFAEHNFNLKSSVYCD